MGMGIGTDIHAVVQVREGNEWVIVDTPRLPRNYELFTCLANVRRIEGVDVISYPRGLPVGLDTTQEDEDCIKYITPSHDDINCQLYKIQTLFYIGDYSRSFLSFKELIPAGKYSQEIKKLIACYKDAGFDLNDVRLVFGFAFDI